MLHVTLILADTILVATRDRIPGQWSVECCDPVTGKRGSGEWTDSEIGAVMALAMGLGEDRPDLAKDLYLIAANLFEGWPIECRPIP